MAATHKSIEILYESDECMHEKTVDENGRKVCIDCGVETESLSYVPEWRCYDNGPKETSRCRITQTQVSRVGKILNELRIPQAVASIAEEKYNIVVGESTTRGDRSKAILAACLMFGYRERGIVYPADTVIKKFKITQKIMSQGLSAYYDKFPNDRTKSVYPKDLISSLIKSIGLSETCEKDIISIAEQLQNTSIELSRSEPQSVAAAIIFLYTCWHTEYDLCISKKDFAERAGLSVVTIVRLAKIAAEKLGLAVEI